MSRSPVGLVSSMPPCRLGEAYLRFGQVPAEETWGERVVAVGWRWWGWWARSVPVGAGADRRVHLAGPCSERTTTFGCHRRMSKPRRTSHSWPSTSMVMKSRHGACSSFRMSSRVLAGTVVVRVWNRRGTCRWPGASKPREVSRRVVGHVEGDFVGLPRRDHRRLDGAKAGAAASALFGDDGVRLDQYPPPAGLFKVVSACCRVRRRCAPTSTQKPRRPQSIRAKMRSSWCWALK